MRPLLSVTQKLTVKLIEFIKIAWPLYAPLKNPANCKENKEGKKILDSDVEYSGAVRLNGNFGKSDSGLCTFYGVCSLKRRQRVRKNESE